MIIENQQKAIESRNSNILLSASAGTGKTYTMVKRVISLLESGADISEFLVLAFGEDASKEMKDRIEKGISQLAKEDKKYYPQLKKLKIASISTIHSFALEITKTYFAVSGASPKARVLLGADCDVLQATAMENVFLNLYEEGSEDFLSLVEYFIQGRKDELLKETIFKLFTQSRNMPHGEFQKNFFEGLDSGVLQNEYLKITKTTAQSILESCVETCPVHEIYQQQHSQLRDILNAIINAPTLADVSIVTGTEFITKKSPSKNDPNESLKIACDNFYLLVRDRVKNFINKIKADIYAGLETAKFAQEYHNTASKLFDITNLFEKEYSRLKLEKDYVDFSDTEHMLLSVLQDEKSRAELQTRYKYIFCDEYQDVSKIQEEILSLLSQKGNLFTVGDIKQSIFGFRACDQTVIKNRERNILATNNGLLLPMNTNFRSHSDILEFVNSVFSASMTNPEICEYEKSSMFDAMANYPDLGGVEIAIAKKKTAPPIPKQEVYSVTGDKGAPREELTAQAEGCHIARFIKKYLGTRFDFPDGNREVQLSDFVILLRSISGKFAKTISRVLEDSNLPSYIVSSETTLKSHPKVLFIVDFLKTIACPYDDIALYSSLVSPFFDIADSVLFEIRNSTSAKHFHECFFAFATQTAEKYQLPEINITSTTQENNEQQNAQETSPQSDENTACSDIFKKDFTQIIQDTNASQPELAVAKFMLGYQKYRTLASVSCADMLKTAIAENLVCEKVNLVYGESEWLFASELISFISSLPDASLSYACENLEKAMGTIKFTGSGAVPNAVRIMTMHKSKGLEFPFTIIAGTGKKYNSQSTNEVVLFHKDYGIAFSHRDIETRKTSNTFEKITLAQILRRDLKNEEQRLLYVALTRAKFKLLITGTLDCDFYIQDNLVVADKLPILGGRDDFYNFDCHLKLILASLAKTKYACNYQITRIGEEDQPPEIEVIPFEENSTFASALAKRLSTGASKKFDIIPSKFTATQRLENLAHLGKFTETEEGSLQILEKYEVGKIIDFASTTKQKETDQGQNGENREYSKAEIGTNYHKILEEVPFYQTAENIASFVADMIEKEEIIDYPYDTQKIFKLTNNPMFQGISPHREVPFVMDMQSEMFGLEAGTTLLCQGIIDCVFETPNGGLILVDYKATGIKSHKILRDKYYAQLETYKIACEKILKKQVEKCFIYSIFFEDLIEVDC